MSTRALVVGIVTTVLIGIGLSGCQTMPESGSGDDQTGTLGEVKEQSPADVYVELGIAYMRERQHAVALRKLKQAVEADPKSARAHNVIALLYEQLGESEQAEKHYLRAVKLDPDNPFIRNAWGSFLCNGEDYEAALVQFAKALENPLYPTPWVAMTNAGLCANRAGDKKTAERYFRQALTRNPKFPIALSQMAELNFDQRNFLSSRAYLQRYLAEAKHTPRTLWLGFQVENELGDRDTAASYKLLLQSKFPDSQEVQYLREYEQR